MPDLLCRLDVASNRSKKVNTVSDVPIVKVTLLALEGIMGYTLTGPFDIFSSIGECWQAVSGEPISTKFEVEIAGHKVGMVQCFNKLKIYSERHFLDIQQTDLIIIPSVELGSNGYGAVSPELVRWLRMHYKQGAVIASVCAGSFVLAEAGLLDNKIATTHWAFADLFKKNYPPITLHKKEMLTDDQRIVCAGGAASWQFLTCHLLEKFASTEVASQANRFFLLSAGADKQIASMPLAAKLTDDDIIIRAAQLWMKEHLAEKGLLAKTIHFSGLTERTFKRRFKQALMQTPLEYIQNIRIERAKRLLEDENSSIMDILDHIGYAEDSYFRRLFKRKVGLTANEYKRKFALPRTH
jgi:transcriptional regulator GlxA family with amidase domain